MSINLKTWSIFIPIYNLEISPEIGGEIRIEEVIFINSSKIPKIRNRLGLKYKVSEYNNKLESQKRDLLFTSAKTYAFIKRRREYKSPFDKEFKKIQEAVFLLASSQFYRERRKRFQFGGPQFNKNWDEVLIFENKGEEAYSKYNLIYPHEPYRLNKLWQSFFSRHFFFNLLRILNGKSDIQENWKYCIRRASIFAGRSQFAPNLWEAFLYDIIAIETLLKIDRNNISNQIIDSLVSFFGWLKNEDRSYWEDMFKRLYYIRSEIVHNGDTKEFTTNDLINADMILANLLNNICRLTKIIKSKKDLITFNSMLKARKILGMKRSKKPLLTFGRNRYSESDIEKIEELRHWLV
jgi:hypothetical protein